MTADYAEAVARVVQRLLDGDIAYRPGTDPFGDLLRRAHDQGLPQIDEGSVARKERLLEFLRHREDDGTNGETGEPVPDIVIGQ